MSPFISQLLDSAGINGANAFAGFCGGLVHIFWYRQTKPFDAAAAIVGGTLTAIYMGEPLATHSGLSPGFVCFLIGLLGMKGIAPIITKIRERMGLGLDNGAIPHDTV